MAGERLQAIRGMNDVLPEQTPAWRFLEKAFAHCLLQYGYQEIRFPLVESTQLFKRSIGEVTDIVEKEMYTFTDLNGDSITLRPEGTAGCLRACLQHGLLHNQQPKLWYVGPMFRHEKPQKGRYRQFNQLGVEVLGIPGVAPELELILICQRLWKDLSLANLTLEINTLGELSERHAYREQLISYFQRHSSRLDEDSKRRLHRNPLRILDSKNPEMQSLLSEAPKLANFLSDKSKKHFDDLCNGLEKLGTPYVVNPCLVRGLDYYGHTVFEWVTDKLGSQATVCAGGRYDILVAQLGGEPTPAVGFAMGAERLLLLMEQLEEVSEQLSLFFIATDEQGLENALALAEGLRDSYPEWQVIVNTLAGSFKSQFRKADKSGARYALILGEEEKSAAKISIKDLRDAQVPQVTISQNELKAYFAKISTQAKQGKG